MTTRAHSSAARIASALASLLLLLVAAGSGWEPAAAAPASKAAAPGPAGDPLAVLVEERIDALRRKAAAMPESDEEWKDLGPFVELLLNLAEREATAGRLYAALERVADANRYLGGAAFRIGHPEMAASLDRFTEGWSAADRELSAGEAAWKTGSWDRIPAALRGLAEIEYSQARHLYSASRDYGVADGPASGTHYVGQALAAMELARAVQELRFADRPGAFPDRSWSREIAALDAKVVASYEPPRSIDHHNEFIQIDGTLKMAAELDAAGLRHGALVAWLRAERLFGAAEAGWSGATPPSLDSLRAEAARIPDRLKRPGDDSITLLLRQQAESAIDRAAEPESAAIQIASAGAVVARAVPAWAEARDRKPQPVAAAKDQVRVTLVRWPYT